jgi:hypothetical protein
MHATSNSMKMFTWALTIITFCCLTLSTLSGLFETPWLAYFWYAALAAIASMSLLTILLAIISIIKHS